MNKEKILENIKKYNFYHRIQLTDEIITPGINRAQITKNLKEINKLDLKNKKILDIGCRDGIYCFEAEKLGAKEIIGIDNDVSKAAIEFLIPYFNSKVKMYEKNLFDLKEQDYGKFDVIFFPGTLYHLRYPFHALKIVTDLLKEGGTVLIETAILLEDNSRAILYCPTKNDGPYGSTSCTFFNPKGLVDTLESLGIKVLNYQLSIKENFIKNLIKSILRNFKIKTFFGKKLTSVCRGLFICKKDSSIIEKKDYEYWNFTHKGHSLYQKDSKSYKEFYKLSE